MYCCARFAMLDARIPVSACLARLPEPNVIQNGPTDFISIAVIQLQCSAQVKRIFELRRTKTEAPS